MDGRVGCQHTWQRVHARPKSTLHRIAMTIVPTHTRTLHRLALRTMATPRMSLPALQHRRGKGPRSYEASPIDALLGLRGNGVLYTHKQMRGYEGGARAAGRRQVVRD